MPTTSEFAGSTATKTYALPSRIGDRLLMSVPRIAFYLLETNLPSGGLLSALLTGWGASKPFSPITRVGPLLATALVASVAGPRTFRSGRNFSAWIGLVPRKRCRLHGGLSPGAPRGSRNGNYRRWDWTAEAIE